MTNGEWSDWVKRLSAEVEMLRSRLLWTSDLLSFYRSRATDKTRAEAEVWERENPKPGAAT